MRNKKIARYVCLSFVALISSLAAVSMIRAWTEPTAAPTDGSINAPINTGNAEQTKLGALTIGNTDWTQLKLYSSLNDTYNPLTGGSDKAHYHFGFSSVPSGKAPLLEIPADLWIIGNNNTKVDGTIRAGGELQSTLSSGYGQLRMVGGNYGAMWRNDGANTYFLLTNSGDPYGSWRDPTRPLYINNASGDVTVGTKLCLGGQCCSSWTECAALSGPTCLANGAACTNASQCCSGACSSVCYNDGSFTAPCVSNLGVGKKRIFVTSSGYAGGLVDTLNEADAICRLKANNASLPNPNSYKALLSVQGRSPYDVLAGGNEFYVGQRLANGTDCKNIRVAQSPSDFFTTDGTNYIEAKINYDEGGTLQNGILVWTNFQPIGGGTYNLLNPGANYGVCYRWPYWCEAYCAMGAKHFYGNTGITGVGWAYTLWQKNDMYNDYGPECNLGPKALYCVQTL